MQLELALADHERELSGLVAGIIAHNGGLQEVAHRLDVTADYLAHALRRDRHYAIKLDHLVLLVQLDGGVAIVEYLAGLCGHECITARPASPEETVVAMQQAARQLLGGELHKGFRSAVTRRLKENRAARRVTEGDTE